MSGIDAITEEMAFWGLKAAYEEEFDVFQDAIEGDDPEVSRSVEMAEKQLLELFERHQESSAELESTPLLPFPPDDLPNHQPHAYPCRSTHEILPAPPSKWPQAPVMLRPTPRTHTRIRGIRHADSKEYRDYAGFCAGCILPINNGSEAPGKSLVIDFETKYFVGSLLLRIKDVTAAEKQHQAEVCYFEGKRRRFQGVVKGRFKIDLPMSRCVTGQTFDRPGGKLPAGWIVRSFIKFVSVLAPQLEATIDGNHPRFLTPLAATAQTVIQTEVKTYGKRGKSKEEKDDLSDYTYYRGASKDIEIGLEEPPGDAPESILSNIPNYVPSSYAFSSKAKLRQKARKKALDHVSAHKLHEPVFRTNNIYCFEFYQHLLLFDPFSIDMGSPIGKVGLAQPLDGQPLKFMAAFRELDDDKRLEPLWSFDIWHESLFAFAQAHHSSNRDE